MTAEFLSCPLLLPGISFMVVRPKLIPPTCLWCEMFSPGKSYFLFPNHLRLTVEIPSSSPSGAPTKSLRYAHSPLTSPLKPTGNGKARTELSVTNVADRGVSFGSPGISKKRAVRMSSGLLGSKVPKFEIVTTRSEFETANTTDAFNLEVGVTPLPDASNVTAARACAEIANNARATKNLPVFFIDLIPYS